MEKHCNNSQCFKEKNYKAKFLINSILKKINSIETILKNKITKKNKKREKKPCGKHCSNSQSFVMKVTMLPHMI